jgi:hypothetical protein
MSAFHVVRRLSKGAIPAAAAAAALLGMGIAHADETTADLNGWTVQTDVTPPLL